MKKTLLLYGILLLSGVKAQTQLDYLDFLRSNIRPTNTKSSALISLKDSVYFLYWSNSDNAMVLNRKNSYGYDALFNESSCIGWYNTSIGGPPQWQKSDRYVDYSYNGNGNLLNKTFQVCSAGCASWINSSLQTNTYDASNNLTSRLFQNWDEVSLSWRNSERELNAYDAKNNLIGSILQDWNQTSLAWENSIKFSATFNANNEYTSATIHVWNSSTNAWVEAGKMMNIKYLNGDLVGWESWYIEASTSTYKPQENEIMTYNSNHQMLTHTWQEWNSVSESWKNYFQINYTYDSFGNLIFKLSQNWQPESNTWVPTSAEQSFFSTFALVMEDLVSKNKIKSFPNPVTNELIIQINDTREVDYSYQLFDSFGKTILSSNLLPSGNTIVDTSPLANGFYTLKILSHSGNVIRVIKVVK